MSSGVKPGIAITMGDPCGIGPEVVAKALADPRVYESCRPLVVVAATPLERAVELSGSGSANQRSWPIPTGRPRTAASLTCWISVPQP